MRKSSRQRVNVQSSNPKDRAGRNKAPLTLIPPDFLYLLSYVFRLGAEKYGPYNWRDNRVNYRVYLEAAMRHILLASDGEDVDEESGLPHEVHAAANLAIVVDAKLCGIIIDDRYQTRLLNQLGKELLRKKSLQISTGSKKV